MKLFSGSANKPLAEKIARALAIAVSPVEIYIFPDGERRVRVLENVLEEDILIIQSTGAPVDQNYIELFLLTDALKRSGARQIFAVIPYLGYQRQDHVFRDGEAVSLEVMAKLLAATGIDRIFSFDLHSVKIPEIFSLPLIHLSAMELFAAEIKKNNWNTQESVLISPDMGGIHRIKLLSQLLSDMPFVIIEKDRNLANGEIQDIAFAGNLAKRALVVDDMIASGMTMVKASELLHKNGVEEIILLVTHPVFSENAAQFLAASFADKIFVTDTIAIPEEKVFPKLQVLSITAEIVKELSQL